MKDNIFRQLAEWSRFGLVGILATLAYLLVSFAAISIEISVFWTNLIGYLAGMTVSYVGHSKFTFRSEQAHHVQGPKFMVLSLITFGLTNVVIYIVTDVFHANALVGSLAVAGSIPAISWALARFWVFQDTESHCLEKED